MGTVMDRHAFALDQTWKTHLLPRETKRSRRRCDIADGHSLRAVRARRSRVPTQYVRASGKKREGNVVSTREHRHELEGKPTHSDGLLRNGAHVERYRQGCGTLRILSH
jgi:hypothetical protein